MGTAAASPASLASTAGAAAMDDVAKARRLPWALLSSGLSSVYANLTLGTVIVLFYDRLGLPKTHIGILNALIFLPGPLSLVVAPLAARWGFKRTYITFYSSRKVVVALLAACPYVLDRAGVGGLLAYTTAVMGVFGVLRVIAETALYPWAHEYVPNRWRGQFGAAANIVSTLVGLGAVAWAGGYLSARPGLAAYQQLIVLGSAFGLASVLVKLPLPGGGPAPGVVSQRAHFGAMRRALRDAGLRRFLWGLTAVTLSVHAWGAFLPLYFKEEVGLSAGLVVGLQTWFLLGTLLSSYLWGWLADRLGSRPVLLSGLGAMLLLPPLWLWLPRGEDAIFWAGAAAALWGVGSIGYSLGHDRQLFVEIVPARQKTEYMALYYTWSQVGAVISPLLAGWGLDRSAGLQGEWLGLPLGPYTPFFVLSLAGLLVGAGLFARIPRVAGHGAAAGGGQTP
jgi:MFS family permease